LPPNRALILSGLLGIACRAGPDAPAAPPPSQPPERTLPGEPVGALAGQGPGRGASSGEEPSAGQPEATPGTSGSGGRETTPLPDGAPPARSTGPGDWGAGDYPPALRAQEYLELAGVAGQGELRRQYKVHVPPSYDPELPTPLVFCFHGLAQNAVSFCVDGSGMVAAADERGYILAMPNGFNSSWNAGTCCGDASARQLDDVALVRALVAELGAHLNLDLDRIYATGFSNGGYLSARLACEAPDLVAAVAPGSGAIGTNDNGGGTNAMSDFVACEPARAVSVLALHGTEDTLVPYRMHQPALAFFAAAAGCDAATSPAADPPSGGDTQCVSHGACPEGIEVTGCTVAGGGHVWFGDPSCGTGVGPLGCVFVGANSAALDNTRAAWDFFERTATARSADAPVTGQR
jgi:polyhydroxybutyrate depolymerase